ncbi:binuclear zinc transcription factor [Dendryphion nanum]|uniref:Binuclear zinc transcription factor n=1 Tax=Dendryphion nanum TaxID=256645 RepID=A0A9P9D6A6_9PLEO|nr:binuclear zinc transcription factor [Dendryphion nanum]
MPSTASESPDDSFFNDLSQQHLSSHENRPSPTRTTSQDAQRDAQKEDAQNKPKRIACILCRKRKLRCDGTRPTCGTCNRLSHDCAYDEVRKKSGPKRGYVKLLEARLQQVETLLKNQDSTEQNKDNHLQDATSAYVASTMQQGLQNGNDFLGVDKGAASFSESISPGPEGLPANGSTTINAGERDFPWEMIGLGLDEPLPPQDVMNDLYDIYFTKIHPSLPIIHRPRFLAAMNLAPHMRPPVCLRYMMWTLAASVTDKYEGLQEHFYQRARKYIQMDEMKGHGESTITLAHCQTWVLTCTYEFKMMYFPRAWLSAGRAVRLTQMMQLHRLDGIGLDVKQCLPPPKDWTEREERRRTFWMAFCVDRYASIGTGWPMTIDERDILTNLPASEMAFEKSKPIPTGSLEQALSSGGASNIQPFGGIVLTAALFGRNLLHLHRPGADDCDADLNGAFWSRHRSIETILLNTALNLPDDLRLPAGVKDPNVVFMNMSIHTSAICLHQAAIYKADKHRLPINVSNESKIRCVTAAAEIASLMRMVSHMDLSAMNPFISFCVYVAARVFVQYLKTRPKDQQMNSSLQFLLQAMHALRRKNPLTESFLAQLDLDLDGAGVAGISAKKPLHSSNHYNVVTARANTDSVTCSPIFDIRELQSEKAPLNQHGGNSGPNSRTQFRGNTTGPPFHVANAPINMDTQATPAFVPSQGSKQIHLTSREKSTNHDRFNTNNVFNLDDSNEMDISADGSVDQPSPATLNSQSHGGSTSQSSYSPGQHQEEIHNLQYRPSPKPMSNQVPLPHSEVAHNGNQYYSTSEEMFQTSMYSNAAPLMNNDSLNNGFLNTNDWDMTAMGTGVTPMSEGNWNQMLENITLGWDSLGPPHGAIVDGRFESSHAR